MSDMKAVSRRVETDIKSSFSIVDQFFDLFLIRNLCY